MEKILITVCARGGSKGIPGKNIKTMAGKPLIYYTLKLAREFQQYHPGTLIYLSTDSGEIKNAVENLEMEEVNTDYNRPPKLGEDSAGKMDAIIDLKNYVETRCGFKFNYVMDLDVTSPLRTLEDLETAFKKLVKNKEALNIFSVNPAGRNPYFNMVELDEKGFAGLCKKGNFLTRQSAPAVYDMNASFYLFKAKFFESRAALMHRAIIYEMPHLCFDLDHPVDFDFMTYMLENDKLKFDFLQ